MKRTFGAAVVVALFSLGSLAHAAPAELVMDPAGPVVRASAAPVTPTFRTLDSEQQTLSIAATKALLASDQAKFWTVTSVQAPECSKADERALARTRKKTEVKECRQKRADCAIAIKFAGKHKVHAACSSLYSLTTVHLTTRSGGVK